MAKKLIPHLHDSYQLKCCGDVGYITWPHSFTALGDAQKEAEELVKHRMLVDAIEIHHISHVMTIVRD